MNAIHYQIVAFTSGFRRKRSDFPFEVDFYKTFVQKLIVKIAFPFRVETAIGKNLPLTTGQLFESTMFNRQNILTSYRI